MPLPWLNGNLKTALGIGGILLTLGAGYGMMQSTMNQLTTRVAVVEQQLDEAKTNPNASAVGAELQTEIIEINKRLDRIEAKQDLILNAIGHAK